MVLCPFLAAHNSGVWPSDSEKSGLAPFSTNILEVLKFQTSAAIDDGVRLPRS